MEKKNMLFKIFVSLLLIVGVDLIAKDSSKFKIDCLSSSCIEKFEKAFPDQIFIGSVTYKFDFDYDQSFIRYLVGIEDNSEIKRSDLLSALFYLRQLDRFKSIALEIEEVDQSYDLRFYLYGQKVFSRLILSGSIWDKTVCRSSYLLDGSEIFDNQKHQHSLVGIKDYFNDSGYWNSTLKDQIIENPIDKTISVKLEIDKGRRFLIGDILFHLKSISEIPGTYFDDLKYELDELKLKKFNQKFYSKDGLRKIESKIKEIVERHGFMNFDLSLKKDIDQKRRRVTLNFFITLDKKKKFVFWGNHFFSKEELLDHLLMYGKSSCHFPASIIADEFIQLYKNRGFWDISVSIKEEESRFFCLINEGVRASINSIEFKDNDSFDSKLLERQIKPLLRARNYDKDLFKKSINNLIHFYKQLGFWDFKIVKEDFLKVDDNRKYKLVLTLDEGVQRKIGSYKIEDYPELEIQGPFLQMKKKTGIGFDQMAILEQKQWLVRHFKNLGYSSISADYELHDAENGRLNLIWKISLKERAATFGKAIIIGSSSVSKQNIMREIAFNEGDEWSKSDLEETLKRLRGLEIFDSIQIYPGRELDNNLQKPIFVKLIDADRYELRTRMGFQQVGKDFRLNRGFTYKLSGTCFVRNPFKVGDRFVADVDFTRYYRNISTAYYAPCLFDRSVRAQYKIYDSVYNQPVYLGSKSSLYQSGKYGGLFGLTKISDDATISAVFGYELSGIKSAGQSELNEVIDYDITLLDKKRGHIFIEPTFLLQRVDNLLNPHSGYLSFVSLKGMIDFESKSSFLRMLLEHSYYFPIQESLVIAFRTRVGHIFNQNYNQLNPTERFYLGGANSVRGYDRDYLPPLGKLSNPIEDIYAALPKDAGGFWRYAPQGGRTMLNVNLELRLFCVANFGMVFFNDLGILLKDIKDEELQNYSKNILGGTGFGLRYDTPIGPLRFDIAIKWHKLFNDFESNYSWYLTLGHAF